MSEYLYEMTTNTKWCRGVKNADHFITIYFSTLLFYKPQLLLHLYIFFLDSTLFDFYS